MEKVTNKTIEQTIAKLRFGCPFMPITKEQFCEFDVKAYERTGLAAADLIEQMAREIDELKERVKSNG